MPLYNQAQTFTITGGTGIYAGASGSGTLERALGGGEQAGTRYGRETWTGTLTVPGLDFDVVAPTISGAISKTMKAKKGAKNARVTYRVTAQDDRDGAVGVMDDPVGGAAKVRHAPVADDDARGRLGGGGLQQLRPRGARGHR